MSNKLYRILNEEESYDILYTSYINQSARKNRVIEFYEQIEKVCKLSQECNIKISSALRIATQYGWVIEDVQQMVRESASEIPLDLFMVYNEQKEYIPIQPLVDFIVEYNTYYQETGIFLDDEKGHGQYFWEVIWEMVRRKEFPETFSRLDSCFAFIDKGDTIQFADELREPGYKLAEINLEDAEVQLYDMQWITDVPVSSSMQEAIEYARNYWKGLKTKHPITEALICGDYTFKESGDD